MKQELKEFIQEAKEARESWSFARINSDELAVYYDQMLSRLEAMESQIVELESYKALHPEMSIKRPTVFEAMNHDRDKPNK